MASFDADDLNRDDIFKQLITSSQKGQFFPSGRNNPAMRVGGEAGTPPAGVDDNAITRKIDTLTSTLRYEGRTRAFGDSDAEPDSSVAIWQVKSVFTIGGEETTLFAGDGKFNQIWDDRVSLFPIFANEFSAELVGVDEHINMGDVAGFERTDPFSVFSWIKVSTTNLAMLATRMQAGSPNRGWQFYKRNTDGKIVLDLANDFGTSNVIRVRSTVDINDNIWRHVGVTYNGSSGAAGVKLYIDGSLAAKVEELDNLTATIVPVGVNLNIGARDAGNFWEGKVDEPAIYDRVLSASEVSDVYGSGTPPDLAKLTSASNLFGWWRFTQVDKDNFPTIADHSGNGRDGTAISMVVANIQSDTPP